MKKQLTYVTDGLGSLLGWISMLVIATQATATLIVIEPIHSDFLNTFTIESITQRNYSSPSTFDSTAFLDKLNFLPNHQRRVESSTATVVKRVGSMPPTKQLATMLEKAGKRQQAIAILRRVVNIKPEDAEAHKQLALLLTIEGEHADAVEHLNRALELTPDDVRAVCNRATVLNQQGQFAEAIAGYREALRLAPTFNSAKNNLARMLVTVSEPSLREPQEAVELAEELCSATKNQNPVYLDTLATAYAAVGRFDDAIDAARRAFRLALGRGQVALAKAIAEQLQHYQQIQSLK